MTESHEKFRYRGKVEKVKLIQINSPAMAYLAIRLTNGEPVKALYARDALKFLFDITEGVDIEVYGHYNHKKQFIIERYLVHSPTDPVFGPHKPGNPNLYYPSKRRN